MSTRTLVAVALLLPAFAVAVWAGPEEAKSDKDVATRISELAAKVDALQARVVTLESRTLPVTLDDAAFRAALERVEATRRTEREAERQKASEERLLRRLDRLEMGLTDEQKAKLVSLATVHAKARRATFTELRETGAGREEFRVAMELHREELQKAIGKIVPNESDAEKVTMVLGSGGGMRGR